MANKSLHIDIRVGESLSIEHGRIVITLAEKSGQRARLHFATADNTILIEPVRARAAGEELAVKT